MSPLVCRRPLVGLVAITVALVFQSGSAHAQPGSAELGKLDTSLRLVPADASFYTTALRNREQIDALLKSRAWAELMTLPAVQDLLQKGREALGKPDSPFAQVLELYKQPENQQLVELLLDLGGHEVFCYGGDNLAGFLKLAALLNSSSRYGPFLMQLQNRGNVDPQHAQALFLLSALNENLDLLRAPDLVIGFKAAKPEAVTTQLKRLETLLTGLVEQSPLKGRLKRVKMAGSDFLSLELDGSIVPWDMVPFKDVEMQPGQFDKLRKKLEGLKLTISLGLHKGYVLLGIGESTAHLAKFGEGKTLAQTAELQPLARFADQRLTRIRYSSKKLAEATATQPGDIDGLCEAVQAALPADRVPEEVRKRLDKDLEELAKAWKSQLAEPGPCMAFAFLNGRGQESFSYTWSGNPNPSAARPLTLLDHVDGVPLLAVFGRSSIDVESYRQLVKYIEKADGYFEETVLPLLEPEPRELCTKFLKQAKPLIRRLDETTAKLLFPALADGQWAFALDAKMAGKEWVQGLATEKAMPILEPALVLGVSDAELLKKAMREYRTTLNELLGVIKDVAPPGQVPDFSIPEPQSKKLKAGTLYFWELPGEIPIDRRIMPTAGLSEKVLALTISQPHAERLLASKPLAVDGGPLSKVDRPLLGATYVNWTAIVEAASPWVEFGVGRSLDDNNVDANQKDAITKQVRTGLEILKCFRSYANISYLEGKATVTHGELILQDLK